MQKFCTYKYHKIMTRSATKVLFFRLTDRIKTLFNQAIPIQVSLHI